MGSGKQKCLDGKITVNVKDTQGNDLDGFEVTVRGGGKKQTKSTAGGGLAVFEKLPLIGHDVVVTPPDTTYVQVKVVNKTVKLRKDNKDDIAIFTFEKKWMEFLVIDVKDSKPVQGAKVQLVNAGKADDKHEPATGADGRARVDGLAGNNYNVDGLELTDQFELVSVSKEA